MSKTHILIFKSLPDSTKTKIKNNKKRGNPGNQTILLSSICYCCCLGFFFEICLFIFWLWWVFVAARGLSLMESSSYCSSWCVDFSSQWLLLLWGSLQAHRLQQSCALWALEHGLTSYGTQTQLLPGKWDLSGPGIKPVSLALHGGFFTTVKE